MGERIHEGGVCGRIHEGGVGGMIHEGGVGGFDCYGVSG